VNEETCDNVLSEFIAEVHKRLNEPFYVDLLFIFVVMLARGIEKLKGYQDAIKEEPIQNIVYYANDFLTKILPEFRTSENLEDLQIFTEKDMAKLLEYFFNWLTQKKYLTVKVRLNERYFE
jgi:hypothetical protein